MRLFYLISLFIIISISGFSQINKGFIIKNNNDTIYGYINFEGSLLNSKHCAFQLQLNSDVQIYEPGDIKAFRFVDSKFFVTREIPVNNNPQKVFLEWLIQGRASILTYSQSVSIVRYFLLLENDSLIELSNTKQEIDADDKHYIRNNEEYISTLKFNFRDCPSIQASIEKVPFTSKSLIQITEDYHNRTCATGDCIIYEDRNRKLKFDFGISVDYLSSKLRLNNSLPEYVYLSNTIGYGLAIKITNLPLLSPKYSFRLNFTFQNATYRYDITSLPSYIKDDRICKINYLRIPLQLAYKFTSKKLNPFISLGINLNLRYGYKKYDDYLIDTIKEDPLNYIDRGIKPVQFGINTGFGMNYEFSPYSGILIGYEFEYSPRFFATSVSDHSFILNNLIQLAVYYKIKH